MPRINSAALEGFLKCSLKGYLKLRGEVGSVSEFEQMLIEQRAAISLKANQALLSKGPLETLDRGLPLTVATLKRGSCLILDATLEDEKFSFQFYGVKRVEGSSSFGRFHYAPVLVDEFRQIRKCHKTLLALHGLVLGRLQGKRPEVGFIWNGNKSQLQKVRLDDHIAEADRMMELVEQFACGDAKPPLMLKDHCRICEFQQRCHSQAVKADHLSLLRGITEKEVKRYARKGIFTVTQLSHTFRPRRKGKRSEPKSPKRQEALQATAIRDRTIYVLGNPDLPSCSERVFFDIEADPDEGYVYLIGVLSVRGDTEKRYSLWADDKSQERVILERFLASYSAYYQCRSCGAVFVPREHSRLARYAHGLQGWAMYQHVAHGLSFGAVREMIEVFFDVRIEKSYISHFKTLMARYYEPTRQWLLEKLLSGNLLHVDETMVKLKGTRGYVWALTNLEEVVFVFRPNREGDFLKELLKPFRGVLVSDFYSVYDSIDCPQQKCLVHLIRDMNDDLLANPFDSELRGVTEPFGVLLRAIVETIGQHGLKRSRLRRFRPQIADYFSALESRVPHSDVAQALRSRLLKYQDKLFTFVDYDGIPWNNNNAENAIHRFALYRARVPNMMKESGLTNYLALLSVCHTCYYKGINFWRFLLSRSQDFDAYVHRKAARRPPMVIDTYPEGYLTEFEKLVHRQKRQQPAKRADRNA